VADAIQTEQRQQASGGPQAQTQTQLGQPERAWTPRRASFFRRRPLAKWVMLAAVILVAAGAYWTWRYYSSRETTDDAQVDAHMAPISARVGGPIIAVNVADNQHVEAGAVLAQIDPSDYQLAVERARADLAAAEAAARAAQTGVPITATTTESALSSAEARLLSANAALSAAEKQVAAANAQLNVMQAKLREAEANHAKAAQDLARYKELVAKDEIPRQQFDAAVAAEAATRATVESARADVRRAEEGILVAESQVAQTRGAVAEAQAGVRAAQTAPQQVASSRAQYRNAEARIGQARAAVNLAELNLQYTTIRAPIAGAVGNKTVQVGQVVQPGQALMAIVPLEDIYVTANFKETQLHSMRPGQPAIVSVDTYGGRKYSGRVQSVSPATGEKFSLLPPENATGNYVKVVQRIPVRIELDKGQDPDHLLRPGMSVEVTVIVK